MKITRNPREGPCSAGGQKLLANDAHQYPRYE